MKNIILTGVGNKQTLGNMIAVRLKEKIPDVNLIFIGKDVPDVDFEHTYYNFDFRRIEFLGSICQGIKQNERFDELYAIINCAGMNKLQWLSELDYSTFHDIQKVNFYTPIFLSKYFLDELSRAKGTILNIISKGAHQPFRTSISYNTSKAALSMATKQMARELTGLYGITVFGISPNELDGTNLTEQVANETQNIRGWDYEKMKFMQLSATLNNQLTDPMMLANFIAYLMSSKSHHEMLSGAELQYGI